MKNNLYRILSGFEFSSFEIIDVDVDIDEDVEDAMYSRTYVVITTIEEPLIVKMMESKINTKLHIFHGDGSQVKIYYLPEVINMGNPEPLEYVDQQELDRHGLDGEAFLGEVLHLLNDIQVETSDKIIPYKLNFKEFIDIDTDIMADSF